MSPKDTGAPWSGSNGGGEFGEELKRAHEHQNSKMAAESAAAAGAAAAASATASAATAPADDSENRDPSEATAAAIPGVSETAGEPPAVVAVDADSAVALPEAGPGGGDGAAAAAAAAAAEASAVEEEEVAGGGDGAVESGGAEMAELEPGKVRVRALYDYEATQDGDLSFAAGDMIITDGGAFSGDGWVSGTCHGNTGIFPANYTEPW